MMTLENVEAASPRTNPLDHCPICESEETRSFFSTPDRLHGVPGRFTYHICENCRTVFQNPMVIQEDLHLCYPSEYKPYEYDPEMPEARFEIDRGRGYLAYLRDLIRSGIVKSVRGEFVTGLTGMLSRVLSNSRVLRERAFFGLVTDECLPVSGKGGYALDVGCGAGWMLKRLSKVGWQVEGIEWDEKAAEVAQNRTGQKVWAGDFREIDLPTEKYELIFLSHVFEHLHDPQSALRRFYELLSPNGKLVLLFPNANSTDARWFGECWFPWDAPRHLVFPSEKSLRNVFRRFGFKRLSIRTNVARWVWNSSKAYKLGEDPEVYRAKLNIVESIAFRCQQVLNLIGSKNGSEMVVILHKS